MNTKLLLVLSLLSFGTIVNAGTYDEVITIFNSSCAFSSCHGSSMPVAGLDLSSSNTNIYNDLINVVPQNTVAAAKNNMLIKPGDPARSFMYRKMNHGLHADSDLEAGENQPMPPSVALSSDQIELVRQWILFGAKDNNQDYVDSQVLTDYYTNGGLSRIDAPAPPAAGEGFQLHFGPIFLEPGEEREFAYRYELQNNGAFEVPKIAVDMNDESHHFLFFQFNEGAGNSQDDGLLDVVAGEANAISSNSKMIGGWAYSKELALPTGTALKVIDDAVLKFNYHILNYSNTEIMPAEIYVNVYTDPVGTALLEMHSEFHISIDNSAAGFVYPPGVSDHTWNMNIFDEVENESEVHIWNLAAHTHQWGTDFDIFLNTGGVKGDQIYEGFYNTDYTFNQGFYDYAEPPLKIYPDYVTIDPNDGVIVDAVYNNQSGGLVFVGLTTADEMLGLFIQYLTGDISILPEDTSSIVDTTTNFIDFTENGFEIEFYPNPSTGILNLGLNKVITDAKIAIYNALGELVFTDKVSVLDPTYQIDLTNKEKGFYYVSIANKENTFTQKITLQ